MKIWSHSFHADHEEVGVNETGHRQKGTAQVCLSLAQWRS